MVKRYELYIIMASEIPEEPHVSVHRFHNLKKAMKEATWMRDYELDNCNHLSAFNLYDRVEMKWVEITREEDNEKS